MFRLVLLIYRSFLQSSCYLMLGVFLKILIILGGLAGTLTNYAQTFYFSGKHVDSLGIARNCHQIADIDGDGDPDLTKLVDGQLFVQINNPVNGLINVSPLEMNPWGLTYQANLTHKLADLDNDGDLDWVSVNNKGNNFTVAIFRNEGTQMSLVDSLTFPYVLAYDDPDPEYAYNSAWTKPVKIGFYDHNGDGKQDIQIVSNGYYIEDWQGPCMWMYGEYVFYLWHTHIMLNAGAVDEIGFSTGNVMTYAWGNNNFVADLDGDGLNDTYNGTKVLAGGTNQWFDTNLRRTAVGTLDANSDGRTDVLTDNVLNYGAFNHKPTCISVNTQLYNTLYTFSEGSEYEPDFGYNPNSNYNVHYLPWQGTSFGFSDLNPGDGFAKVQYLGRSPESLPLKYLYEYDSNCGDLVFASQNVQPGGIYNNHPIFGFLTTAIFDTMQVFYRVSDGVSWSDTCSFFFNMAIDSMVVQSDFFLINSYNNVYGSLVAPGRRLSTKPVNGSVSHVFSTNRHGRRCCYSLPADQNKVFNILDPGFISYGSRIYKNDTLTELGFYAKSNYPTNIEVTGWITPLEPSTPARWSVEVENNGRRLSTNILLTLQLPAGVTFAGCSWPHTVADDQIHILFDTLQPYHSVFGFVDLQIDAIPGHGMFKMAAYMPDTLGQYLLLSQERAAVMSANEPDFQAQLQVPQKNTSLLHDFTMDIHFRNTGTDTAQHVVLTSTLPAGLDPTTFEILAGSEFAHFYLEVASRQLTIYLDDINLPPATEGPAVGYGHIRLKARTTGDSLISLSDFNWPFVVNMGNNLADTITGFTFVTDISVAVDNPSAQHREWALNPTPTGSAFRITATDAVNTHVNVTIINSTGSTVWQNTGFVGTPIDVSHLAPGFYLVRISQQGREPVVLPLMKE